MDDKHELMKFKVNPGTDVAIVTLPPGFVVKINGIPVELVGEAIVTTHKNNIGLISEPFKPSCGTGK